MQVASVFAASSCPARQRQPTKGDEIRARIETNRRKRLAIAETMKAEAGVTRHDLNREGEGGLAFIGTGVILSPEGRNMRQLYIVAHECGHIFLHNDGEGYWYPGHMKELEAETYAHQAFRQHGMRMPADLTLWGRQYVGSWIEKDRAAGIRIDPRAAAYAAGLRSPYEPLRKVPDQWADHDPARAQARPLASFVSTALGRHSGRILRDLGTLVGLATTPTARLLRLVFGPDWTTRARDHLAWAWNGYLIGFAAWLVLMLTMQLSGMGALIPIAPRTTYGGPDALTWTGVAVALIGACLAAALHTLLRHEPHTRPDEQGDESR